MKNVEFLDVTIIIDGKIDPKKIDLGAITLKKNGKEYILDIVRTMIYREDEKDITKLVCEVKKDVDTFPICKYDLTENGLLNDLDIAEIFVGGEYTPKYYTLHTKIKGIEKDIPLVSEVTEIKNNCNVSNSDVMKVAKQLKFVTPTTKQINEVLKRIDEQAENDPTGYWAIWIEDLLYEIDLKKE